MAKLIFIDDDIIDHRIFQYMAKKYESAMTITYTVQADTVISYLESHQEEPQLLPDVILIDLKMPGFSGYEFLKQLNELQAYLPKEIHVYILSFSLHPKDLHLINKHPFVKRYLHKPLTDDQLKNIIEMA